MGTQKYFLKIEKPCSEDWNAMTENDQGRFCSSCSKTVTDFTQLTDSEILSVYNKAPIKHCGRFTKSQLEKVIIKKEIDRPTKFLKVAAGLLLALISKDAISASSKINNKPNTISQNVGASYSTSSNITIITTQDSLQSTLKGVLLDSANNDPMPFAHVIIKGTKIGIQTDFDGRFNISIPDSITSEKLTIVITSLGYQPIEIIFDRRLTPTNENVFLISSHGELMGDVVIVKKKWWQRKRRAHR